MKLTNAEIGLIALFVESITYGIFIATFTSCIRALVWDRPRSTMKVWSDINKLLLGTCLLLPVFSTIHLATNFIRSLESLGPSESKQFSTLASHIEGLKFFSIHFQTFLADSIMVGLAV
jgi:hypothetical protein